MLESLVIYHPFIVENLCANCLLDLFFVNNLIINIRFLFKSVLQIGPLDIACREILIIWRTRVLGTQREMASSIMT